MPLPDHIQTLCGCVPWMTLKGYRLAIPTETTSSVQLLSITLLRYKGMKSKRWLPRRSLCRSSAMVQLTTATQRPNWHMFGTVTKGQSMSTLLG